jgi:sugar phosphate isomerase/epimerase
MRLGFFTACLPQLTLADVGRWAAGAGFSALEVAAWPADDPDEFHASHLDPYSLDGSAARHLAGSWQDLGLEVSALGYYANHLHADPATRAASHDHLKAVVDAAALLGVPNVGTFVGRDVTRSVADNVRAAPDVLRPLLDHAAANRVRLMFENCPMTSWHPDGYPANLAYSPELWDWALALGFGLNFDPSHLVVIGIDPVRALQAYLPHVAHVQAKDVELLPERIQRYGHYSRAIDRSDPSQRNVWRYRMPGHGQVDWAEVLLVLKAGGYRGVVSIEHEDPEYAGDVATVQRGLDLGRQHLSAALDAADATRAPTLSGIVREDRT